MPPVDGRTLDTLDKTAELDALIGGSDAESLWDAVGRARLALEFRDTDPIIGLPPVDEDPVRQLRDRVDRAVERAVELGYPPALTHRAESIYFGGDTTRADEAFACATAATGQRRATYLLGLFHHAGFGCEPDIPRSRELQEEAARAGEADAMFELYVFHSTGVGGPVDEDTAADWCRQAAEAGSVRAMANVGVFYATGYGVPVDLSTSIQWYEKAANEGHGRAAAVVGVMTAAGQGVEPDADAARRWFDLADDLGFDWRPLAAINGLDTDEDDLDEDDEDE
jgi:TPR repeat protein